MLSLKALKKSVEEYIYRLKVDELEKDKLIANISLFGLLGLLLIYVVMLFLPYNPPSLSKKGEVIIIKGIYMRKFKGGKIQWWLEAERMDYDDRRARGVFFNGNLYIAGDKGNRTKVTFKKAFSDRRHKHLNLFNVKLIYERSIIYSKEAHYLKKHLYLYSCKVFDLDNTGRIMLSPLGELYENRLRFEDASFIEVSESSSK